MFKLSIILLTDAERSSLLMLNRPLPPAGHQRRSQAAPFGLRLYEDPSSVKCRRDALTASWGLTAERISNCNSDLNAPMCTAGSSARDMVSCWYQKRALSQPRVSARCSNCAAAASARFWNSVKSVRSSFKIPVNEGSGSGSHNVRQSVCSHPIRAPRGCASRNKSPDVRRADRLLVAKAFRAAPT